MGNSINHDIEDHSYHDTVSVDQRKIRLSLSAQSDLSFAFLAADLFAESRILDNDTEAEQIKLSIMSYPRGSIGVVEEIRC